MTLFNATLYNNLTITKKLIRYHINHKHKRSYHSSFVGPNYNNIIQKPIIIISPLGWIIIIYKSYGYDIIIKIKVLKCKEA